MRIALVTCVGGKLDHATQAKDLYTTDLFRKASGYAATNYDAWHILSAEHGLVDPEQVLEPYDKTLKDMPAAGRRAWSLSVLQQIKAKYPPSTEIDVHAGDKYRKYLIPMLAEAGYLVHNAWEGLGGIGLILEFYKNNGRTPPEQ